MSSEWSRAASGRIDIRITKAKWPIKLLRDGDWVTEHCERCSGQGTFHNLVPGAFGTFNGLMPNKILSANLEDMPIIGRLSQAQ
jgi:hypothetical protein